MLAALLVSLAPQGSHAALHPADADYFVEIPDVAALARAYRATPFVRLTGDEGLRASVAKLTEAFGEQVDGFLADAAAATGLSPEQIETAPQTAVDWLGRVRGTSLSIAGCRGALDTFHAARARWLEADDELGRIRELALAAVEAGAAPGGDLELPDELRADPWGQPYELRATTPDEAETHGRFVVTCLGSDGAPGGEGAAGDLVRGELDPDPWEADAVTVETLLAQHGEALSEDLRALVVVDFESPETAAAVAATIVAWGQEGAVDLVEAEVELFGTTRPAHRFRFAPDAPFVTLAQRDASLFVAAGGPRDVAASVRLPGPGGLDEVAAYAELTGQLSQRAGSGPVALRGFHEIGLLELLFDLGTLQAPAEGVEMLEAFRGRTRGAFEERLDDGRFVSTSVLRKADESALDALVGAGSVTADQLALVPDDAIGVLATTVDVTAVWGMLRELVAGVVESDELARVDAELERLRADRGVDVVGDFFASLGTGVTGYLQPLKIGVPNGALVWELADAARMERFLTALAAATEQVTEGAFTFAPTKRPYKGATIWTLRRGGGSLDDAQLATVVDQAFTQLTPSVVLLGDRAVFCLTSLHAKRTIKRSQDEDRVRHPLGSTIAVPSGATSGGYFDWAGMILGLYSIGRGAVGMMGLGGGELPFDVQDLPDPALIEPYFEPSVSWTSKEPSGTWTRKTSSFGPETWLGSVGAVLAGSFVAQAKTARALESAEESYARAELAALDTAVLAYQLDHGGEWPASLDELVTPGESGEGYLRSEDALLDPWDQRYRWQLPEDPDGAARFWSIGPDGVDDGGGGDDIVGE